MKGGIVSYIKEIEKQEGIGAGTSEIDSNNSRSSTNSNDNNTDTITMNSRHLSHSQFHGINYVFDERMGTRITQHHLSTCETCGNVKCDSYCNCLNPTCHIRFIQCRSCGVTYGGCCSSYCYMKLGQYQRELSVKERERKKERERHAVDKWGTRKTINNSSSSSSDSYKNIARAPVCTKADVATPLPLPSHAMESQGPFDALSDYADRYSSPLAPSLLKLYQDTLVAYPNGIAERLCSSPAQGQLLSLLARLKQPKQVLELGTFTGFSAMSIASGILQGQGQGKIYTCEKDEVALSIARPAFKSFNESISEAKVTIECHAINADSMISLMRSKGVVFDFVFIDCDKKGYLKYIQELMGERVGGVSDCNSNSTSLLADGAVVVIDNTLWKGLVLEAESSSNRSISRRNSSSNISSSNVSCSRTSSNRYMAIANSMHELNYYINHHPSLSQLILPIRDGLSVIQYNKKGN